MKKGNTTDGLVSDRQFLNTTASPFVVSTNTQTIIATDEEVNRSLKGSMTDNAEVWKALSDD